MRNLTVTVEPDIARAVVSLYWDTEGNRVWSPYGRGTTGEAILRRNGISNPTAASTNTGGYTATGTLANVTTNYPGAHGARAFQLTSSGSLLYANSTERFSMTAGHWAGFSMLAATSSAGIGNAKLRLQFYDGANALISQTLTDPLPLDGTFKRIRHVAQAPTGTTNVRGYLYFHDAAGSGNPASGATALFDAVMLVTRPTQAGVDADIDDGFFSGDSPSGDVSYRWDGTQYLSFSTEKAALSASWRSAMQNAVSYFAPSRDQIVVRSTDEAVESRVRHEYRQKPNLVANSDFETNAVGWQAESNCTVARSSDAAYLGSHSLRLTMSAAGAGGVGQTTAGQQPVVPGASYTASAYYRPGSTTRTARLYLNWLDGAGSFISNVSGDAVEVAGQWVRPYVTAVAPANAATAYVAPWLAAGAASEVHYVDAVMLERSAYLDPYVSGTSGMRVAPGETYTLLVTATRQTTGETLALDVSLHDDAGTDVATLYDVATATSASADVELRGTFTVPSGDARIAAPVLRVLNPAAGEHSYWGPFTLVRGTYSGGHFDGDSGTGYSWAGTPHASETNDAAAPATVTMTRVNDVTGDVAVVRDGGPAELIGGGWVGQDYEAPLDDAFSYTARADSGATVSAGSFVIPSDERVWLKHPGKPYLNMRTDVTNQPALARGSDTGVFRVLGRSAPVTVSRRRDSGTGVVELVTETADELAQMLALCDDGTPLLLQTPGGTSWGSRYIAVTQLDELPRYGYGYDHARLWGMSFQLVDAPVGSAVSVGNTWADVLSAYPSWLAMAQAASWQDVLQGITATDPPEG